MLKGYGLAAAPIADRIVGECRRVLRLVLECAPQREVQLRLVVIIAGIARQQRLHRRDLGVAEHVVLQVGETPIGFAELRLHPEAILVGLLALAAVAEGLVQVADREPQAHFRGIPSRRLLERDQRVRLAHQPGIHVRASNTQFWGFSDSIFKQVANRRLGLGKPPEIDQRLAESPPDERQVRGLLERMAQQPLRIPRRACRERYRREAAQSADMTGIGLEDVAKDGLGRSSDPPRPGRCAASSMRRAWGSLSRARS